VQEAAFLQVFIAGHFDPTIHAHIGHLDPGKQVPVKLLPLGEAHQIGLIRGGRAGISALADLLSLCFCLLYATI
jgi:hypothetical protein